MSRKMEVQVAVEECPYCDQGSQDLCERHQGILESLPREYVVRCISCGDFFTEVPENGRVECGCGKTLKQRNDGGERL